MWSLVLIICKMHSFIASHIEMEEIIILQERLLEIKKKNGEKIITHLLNEMIANTVKHLF